MHVIIFNGSPRVQKFSNTDKIISSFAEGFCERGNTYELYSISNRREWGDARRAFNENKNILIALPLFVECVPGLMMEFLETLVPKTESTQISYILQGGFAEGSQLRCGEAYLEKLTHELGCKYGGTLVKGNNFMLRFMDEMQVEKETDGYREMGKIFDRDYNFFSEECQRFTGPEIYSLPVRIMLDILFKTAFKNTAISLSKKLGCTKPLDYKTLETDKQWTENLAVHQRAG